MEDATEGEKVPEHATEEEKVPEHATEGEKAPERTTEGEKAPEQPNKQPMGRGRLCPSWRTAGASGALIRVPKITKVYMSPSLPSHSAVGD